MLNLKIALVSTNRETLDGVQEYLTRVGARLSSISRLEEAVRHSGGADVSVLFADDYPRDAALRTIARLTTRLVIVVTGEVKAFKARVAKDGKSRVLVLARPAWGWMLLDAVRLAVPTSQGKG